MWSLRYNSLWTRNLRFLFPMYEIPCRQSPRVHLRAALWVVVAVLVLGTLIEFQALRLERRVIHVVALESSPVKDLGIVWQRAAMAEADILPFYGSSELLRHVGNEPQRLFASYPTGFAVSPVGRGGCTSLILAQKIAAATGHVPRGRKLAVSLSPSWFFHLAAHRRWYVGNFSVAQASALIFSPRLSLDLKRDFARRMLDYPDSLNKSPLLHLAVEQLAGQREIDAAFFHALAPLGRAQGKLTEITEHFAFVWHIYHDHLRDDIPPRSRMRLDWEAMMEDAQEQSFTACPAHKTEEPLSEAAIRGFAHVLGAAREWSDLELLLRLNRELGFDPLLLSIPIDYTYYESIGVARENLDQYSRRLRKVAREYDVAFIDFAEHGDDPSFFADHHDHLSARGWLYVDRTLDFYFHGAKHQRYFPRVGAAGDQGYP